MKVSSHTLVVAALGGLFALQGCGGSGDGPATGATALERARSDPRIVKAEKILEGAGMFLMVANYEEYQYDASVPGGPHERIYVDYYGTCNTGTVCELTNANGRTIGFDKSDFTARTDGRGLTIGRIDLGSRAGFDTGYFEATLSTDRGTYSSEIVTRSFGVWGEHGYAEAYAASGTFSELVQGVWLSGDVRLTSSFVLGEFSGSNPAGVGSATWRGPAEAILVQTQEHRAGTASVTMADLSVPAVDVDVVIGGRQIGSAAWDNIPLQDGAFLAGYYGQDALIGDFFGPQHEEAYAVFDTGIYVGAFGAKRDE